MKKPLLSAALVLVAMHGIAHAGLVKCKKPGGGYTFQDRACPPEPGAPAVKRPVVGDKDPSFAQKSRPGANWERHTPLVVENKAPMAQPAPVPRPEAPALVRAAAATGPKDPYAGQPKPGGDYQSRKAEEERLAHNERVTAQNKAQECEYAREQLGVANLQRRITVREGKGAKQFVSDEDRPRIVARAEKAVAQACN